jgi:hypothetical protein
LFAGWILKPLPCVYSSGEGWALWTTLHRAVQDANALTKASSKAPKPMAGFTISVPSGTLMSSLASTKANKPEAKASGAKRRAMARREE